ncbi:MAG: pectinesterase family protein [Phocaeicola sp.]
MKLKLLLALWATLLLSAFTTAERKVTIFMIGDSTMADKSLTGNNQERGWGHMLPGYLDEQIEVENHAKNGRSSKSFIDEGAWEVVLNRIQKGDYLFIQFGHNDEKSNEKRHTVPGGTFDANLTRFVNEARAKGAIPVLFNSIVRRNFYNNADAVAQDDKPNDASAKSEKVEGELLIDTHGAYLESPRNVAQQLNVPFVDANRITHDLVQGMGRVESKKLFMWMPANTYAAYPKGKEDNSHLNIYGARVVAKLLMEAVGKEVPALASHMQCYDYVVAKDGSGDFFTIQEAINAVPDFRKAARTTILVRKGEYKEKVIVPASKINVSLIGEEGATLTNDDYASKKNCLGDEMSTSGSSTCYIYAPDFYAENITFQNSAGRVGQAVACFVEGDRAYFKNCRFLGNQDTLYTYGKESRQYYENCYIEGTVDFIFGWSTVLFKDCTIHSLGKGYVTAPSTDQGKAYGYVFINCKLTGADEAENVYLSRPWRPYAQAVFIQCDLGKHIAPEGWNNWGKSSNEETVLYAEYKNRGEGAATKKRVSYGQQLRNIDRYSPEQVLLGSDGWNPVRNGNSLLKDIKR